MSADRIEEFTLGALVFNRVFADFNVVFNQTEKTVIKVSGDEEMKEALVFKTNSGIINVTGKLPGVSLFSNIITGHTNDEIIVDGVILDKKRKLKIDISLPKTSALTFNKYSVGTLNYLEDGSDHSLKISSIMSGKARSFNTLNLELDSVGGFDFENIKTNLIILSRSVGSVTAKVTSGKIKITQSGTGSVELKKAIGTLDAKVTSVGSLTIKSANLDEAKISQSGTGSVSIEEGKIDKLFVGLSSIGKFEFDGHANEGSFETTSIGSVTVRSCTKVLRSKATSIGKVRIEN